jgi:4-oxalocrotonate tautomerase
MPVITLQLYEGRTLEQKRHFIKAVTEAACHTLECTAESVDIIIHEVKCEELASGGKLWSD